MCPPLCPPLHDIEMPADVSMFCMVVLIVALIVAVVAVSIPNK